MLCWQQAHTSRVYCISWLHHLLLCLIWSSVILSSNVQYRFVAYKQSLYHMAWVWSWLHHQALCKHTLCCSPSDESPKDTFLRMYPYYKGAYDCHYKLCYEGNDGCGDREYWGQGQEEDCCFDWMVRGLSKEMTFSWNHEKERQSSCSSVHKWSAGSGVGKGVACLRH